MTDVEEKMEQLNEYKEKTEDLKSQKIKLSTQKEEYEKRLDELSQKSKNDFGVDIDKLTERLDELNNEAEENLDKIEKMLGG